MAYPYKYYRYINLPRIPDEILIQLNFNFDHYESKNISRIHDGLYTWSDSFNEIINVWCQENICSEMYWGFQIVRGDMMPHIDSTTLIKMNYVIQTGGDGVITEWYADDKTTVVDSVVFTPHQWHIIKTDAWHAVRNTTPGQIRFAVTGRMF